MQYKGAVFFDIDGTLVDERNKIFVPTDNVKKAIKTLKEKGYLTGVATGRSLCYFPNLGIDFECYVSSNGALVEINGDVVYKMFYPQNDVLEIAKYMDENNTGYSLENSQHSYYKNACDNQFEEFINRFDLPDGAFVPLENPNDVQVNKILVYANNLGQLEEIRQRFESDYTVTNHHGGLTADIINNQISKAKGIEIVAEKIGISMKDTYAFGDDGNDYEMLKAAGCGVAMTPHDKILDEVADFVTLSVKDDGIVYALEKLDVI